MKTLAGFSPIARAVIVAGAIALVVIFLQTAASVIAPILLAAFITVVATPPLRWMQRKRVPKWLALAVIVFVLLEAGSIFALVFTGELEGFRDGLPSYQELRIPLKPAVLLALVQTDLQTTLLVALGYLVVNTVIGSILEPRIMGRGLGISTLVVFLSLLFWGWVLGTVGVFLAVPLTMALIIALDASPQTRPIAILLGPEVTQKPEPEV